MKITATLTDILLLVATMATAPKVVRILNEDPDDLDKRMRRLELTHLHGIKTNSMWNADNRYSFTYFLLPPSTLNAPIEGGVDEFINFWRKLDDNHKERRFLASYMAATVFAVNVSNKKSISPEEMAAILRNRFVSDVGTQSLLVFRVIFTDKAAVEGIVKVLFDGSELLLEDVFGVTVTNFLESCSVVDRDRYKMVKKDVAHEYAGSLCQVLLQATFGSFFTMYVIWQSMDEGGKMRYLGKLRVSVPHWRAEDRSYLVAAIRTKGKSCKGTYVGELLKKVRMQKFKVCLLSLAIWNP